MHKSKDALAVKPPAKDTPEYVRWRSCTSKKAYGQRTAFELAFQKGWGSYECKFCGKYHLTTHSIKRATKNV